MHPFQRMFPAGILLMVIVGIGIAGYGLIEGWGMLDSAYMVVITLFTIGFQEVNPLSPAGKIFTMFLAVAGVGTAVYAGGRAVEIIVEGEMSGYRKKKRMNRKMREMKQHYIICGYGRVGRQVAQVFEASQVPYVVIDNSREAIADLDVRNVPYVFGDATSDDVLLSASILAARGLIACSDSDVDNVYVTLSARALNANLRIVSRAGIRDTEKKLMMAGADRVISPYFISGTRMAALVTQPVISDFLDLVTHSGRMEFSLHEMPVPESSLLVGRSLEESDVRGVSGATVLAILKSDGSFDLQPKATSIIAKGSTLVVLGTQEQIKKLDMMVQ
jgi:voltage-gated potassium channel